MTRERWVAAGLALFALFCSIVWGSPVLAQEDGPTDDQVNAIAKQLYCPVCENVPLDACPTQACVQWREMIREKLGQGWTEEQIKQYFVAQYGDRVLATPPAHGLNWLVYVVPPLAAVAGVYILLRAMRRWQRTPRVEKVPPAAAASEDPYVRRLEDELRKGS